MTAYKVELDIYSGPLDLLLYLVDEEEVDIYDIPIATILDRYVEELDRLREIDIERASEFLLMASTLMEIKSRMLLPVEDRPPEEAEDEDPRAEIVRQLLAYRAFKEAAQELAAMSEVRSRRYARGREIKLPDEEARAEPEPLRDVALFDVADAYARLMKQTLASGPRTIIYDEVSIEERMEAIMNALARVQRLALDAVWAAPADRIEIVGTFSALLELVRKFRVSIYQDEEFGPILVALREGEEGDAEAEPGGGAPAVPSSLPPPVERSAEGAPGGKPWRAPRHYRFKGLDGPAIEDDLEDGGEEDSVEVEEKDKSEVRLNRRIDEIIRRADEISERFEASRLGRFRGQEGGPATTAADLDAAMEALESELGPDEDVAATGSAAGPEGVGPGDEALDEPDGDAGDDGLDDATDAKGDETADETANDENIDDTPATECDVD